jgi:hypothetical protein
MTDTEYAEKLIASGVRPDRLEGLSGHALDCIGNIVEVYRTSVEIQNPAHAAIQRYARERNTR